MGPTLRREREKEALRARIMDAARQLFAEKGYEAVTMRMIAEAIEYSPRTIYLHFADKDDLIRQLCEADFAGFSQGMAARLTETDPMARILALGQAYVDFARMYPHHYRLMFMMPSRGCPGAATCSDPANPQQNAYLGLVQAVAAAMEAGCLKPEHQNPQAIAQVLWSSLHGILALHFTHGEDPWIAWEPLESLVQIQLALFRGALERMPNPA